MTNRPQSVLIIIDGFGFSSEISGNAIWAAKTPTLDFLWSHYPHTLLKAAEAEVGLSFGQIGNSEVGHMAIGAGRVVYSPFERVNDSIRDGSFQKNKVLVEALTRANSTDKKLHIIGLLSNAGVHGDINHVLTIVKIAKSFGVKKVFLHLMSDGRDTGSKDAPQYLEIIKSAQKDQGLELLKELKKNPPEKVPFIIALTNLGHDPVVEEALAAGAGDYIVKADVNPDELLERVSNSFSNRTSK